MNPLIGLAVEGIVAVLLVLTLVYCAVLNKRLKRLKADEHSLKATIAELITATEIAERAIGGLKLTVRDCNDNLGSQIAAAVEMTERLQTQIDLGNDVVRRVARIAQVGRGAPVGAPAGAPDQPAGATAAKAAERSKPASARTLAEAAQAFVTRNHRDAGLAA
jgi:hypothetical protein